MLGKTQGETQVMGYLQTPEELLQFTEILDEKEWRPELEQALNEFADKPFETTIRHVLQIA